MHRALILTLALTLGCARADRTLQEAQPAAPLALADLVGTWEGPVRRQGSDSIVAHVEMLATTSPDGWSFTVINAANPLLASTSPARVVTVGGDSIVIEAGPFNSTLRAGEVVSTRSVYRLRGDSLIGLVRAIYFGSGDTVRLSSAATRRR
jgi:hypothetical protein